MSAYRGILLGVLVGMIVWTTFITFLVWVTS